MDMGIAEAAALSLVGQRNAVADVMGVLTEESLAVRVQCARRSNARRTCCSAGGRLSEGRSAACGAASVRGHACCGW